MPKKRLKSTTLSINRQKKVANYKIANPDLSVEMIAEKFNCTPAQVRYAFHKMRKNRFRKTTPKIRRAQAEDIKQTIEASKLFDEQIHLALAELQVEKGLGVMERVSALEKISRARRNQFDLEMQLHLKGLDWKIFCEAIRMFKPDVSDKEIIKIFNEAKALCQISAD